MDQQLERKFPSELGGAIRLLKANATGRPLIKLMTLTFTEDQLAKIAAVRDPAPVASDLRFWNRFMVDFPDFTIKQIRARIRNPVINKPWNKFNNRKKTEAGRELKRTATNAAADAASAAVAAAAATAVAATTPAVAAATAAAQPGAGPGGLH